MAAIRAIEEIVSLLHRHGTTLPQLDYHHNLSKLLHLSDDGDVLEFLACKLSTLGIGWKLSVKL